MNKFRLRVGAIESDLIEEEFAEAVEAALSRLGKISEVPGRGLLVSKINAQGRPGNISRQVVGLLIANPGLSRAKMFRRLPDLTPTQIESAVARLVKNKELVSTRSNRGTGNNFYAIYSTTELGEQKYYEAEQATENARVHARSVWAAWRTLGYRDGSAVDWKRTMEVGELSMEQMKAGIRLLLEKDKVSISGTTEDGHRQYWVKK